MKDVPHGIGRIMFALNAQITGSSTIRVFVFKFQINAIPTIEVEHALVAIKVIISPMESAFLPQFNKSQMLDAPHGTGISKSAFNAQTTGSSTAIKSVFQYLINAQPSTTLEPAFLAIRDTT